MFEWVRHFVCCIAILILISIETHMIVDIIQRMLRLQHHRKILLLRIRWHQYTLFTLQMEIQRHSFGQFQRKFIGSRRNNISQWLNPNRLHPNGKLTIGIIPINKLRRIRDFIRDYNIGAFPHNSRFDNGRTFLINRNIGTAKQYINGDIELRLTIEDVLFVIAFLQGLFYELALAEGDAEAFAVEQDGGVEVGRCGDSEQVVALRAEQFAAPADLQGA